VDARAAGGGNRSQAGEDDAAHLRDLTIEDGRIPLAQLATIMGTSIRELENTDFSWLRRTDDQLRAVLDAYDAVAIR
jgi:hypothetical protein